VNDHLKKDGKILALDSAQGKTARNIYKVGIRDERKVNSCKRAQKMRLNPLQTEFHWYYDIIFVLEFEFVKLGYRYF